MATKHQKRMAVKSELLDQLSQQVFHYETDAGHGLSAEEVGAVYAELAEQLYAWAVRIVPLGDLIH